MEHIITLNDALDTPTFYGVNNQNMLCLRNQHPEVRVVARGYQVKATGSEAAVERFEQSLRLCESFCLRNNRLTEQDILMLAEVINLSEVPDQRVKLSILPLKLDETCAAPCRAFIEVP